MDGTRCDDELSVCLSIPLRNWSIWLRSLAGGEILCLFIQRMRFEIWGHLWFIMAWKLNMFQANICKWKMKIQSFTHFTDPQYICQHSKYQEWIWSMNGHHSEQPPQCSMRHILSHQQTQWAGFVVAHWSWAAPGLRSGRFAAVATLVLHCMVKRPNSQMLY